QQVHPPGYFGGRLNGRHVPYFEPLEDVVDSNVGGQVELELERGGKPVSAKLPVGDLHAITPSAYAEFGDAVLNTLSYQQARHFNVPVRGVYVANPGYIFAAAGVPRGAVLTAMDSKKVDSLADVEQHMAQLGDGDRTTVRFITIDDPNGSQLRSVRMDRRWFPAHHCERDDRQGLWDCKDLAAGPAPK